MAIKCANCGHRVGVNGPCKVCAARSRFVSADSLKHPVFYIAQERAFAPGIVKTWPKVFAMPRLCPHGRVVMQTHEQVIEELRRLGYTVTAPQAVN